MFPPPPRPRRELGEPESAPIEDRVGQLEQRVHELEVRRLPDVVQAAHFNDFTAGNSVADDLEEISAQVTSQGQAIEELQADVESAAGEAKKKVSPGHSGATMRWTGRIHADYWAFPGDSPGVNELESGDPAISPQDRFIFRRLRLGAQGDLFDNMFYKIEFEFADPSSFQYRDIYIGWKDLPLVQSVQVGNQKRPYSLDALNSSRFNVFLERPFIADGFDEEARRMGICSYNVSPDQQFNWRYGIYNLRNTQDDGGAINDDYQPELAGRFAHTWWYDESSDGRGYAHWAVSGTNAWPDGNAPNNGTQDNEARFRARPEGRSTNRWLDTGRIAGAERYHMLGLEKVVNVGPLQVVGEYHTIYLNRAPGFGTTEDLYFHGGYGYVAWFLTGEHIPWEREDGIIGRAEPFENFFLIERATGGVGGGWGAWQIAYRYSYADFTDADIFGGIGSSHTLGLNWYLSPYSKVQFNYVNGFIEQREAGSGLVAGGYDIMGTRLVVDF
jgi:phosphate-selective porin OprO/OprP